MSQLVELQHVRRNWTLMERADVDELANRFIASLPLRLKPRLTADQSNSLDAFINTSTDTSIQTLPSIDVKKRVLQLLRERVAMARQQSINLTQ